MMASDDGVFNPGPERRDDGSPDAALSPRPAPDSPLSRFGLPGTTFAALLAAAALFLAMRVPHVGHLLTYDEAWNEQAVRSLVSGEHNVFRHNLSRHPPLYMLLGSVAVRGAGDPAARLEWLSLLLNLGCLVALFLVVRDVWGENAACWAAFAYALLPAAAFYDTWIKRDCVASLAGLLALLAWNRRRTGLCGLAMGLAFLGKETAVFYAQSLFWLALLPRPRKDQLRRLAVVAALTAAVAGWWYIVVWETGKHFLGFFAGRSTESTRFAEPALYYLTNVPRHLGWGGTALAILGCAVAVAEACRAWKERSSALLPLLLLIPALTVLTVSRGKPPWLVIPLLPMWAALVGVGASWLSRRLVKLLNRWLPATGGRARTVPALAAAAVAALACALPRPWHGAYDQKLRRETERIWAGAMMSREIAQAVNRVTEPDDRLLLTTFSYLSEQTRYCPVFLHYLDPRSAVVRSHSSSFEDLVHAIREHKLDWAVLSPGPQPETTPLARRFQAALRQRPVALSGAVLFRVRKLHGQEQ